MPTPTFTDPNIDRLAPTPEIEIDPDQRHAPELDDDLGNDGRGTPDMVPPGTVIERRDDQRDIEGDNDGTRDRDIEGDNDGSHKQDIEPDRGGTDPEAIEADRAAARSSDRTDARDGVDASDSIARDPDAVGGKASARTKGRGRKS